MTVICLSAACCLGAAPPPAPPVDLYSPAHISYAIQKAVEFVYSKQHDNGQWEDSPTRIGGDKDNNDYAKMQGTSWGGFTALSTYALLAAGESPNDPRIQKAVKFLERADITGVYSIGLRAQVWTFLPNSPDVVMAAQHDYHLLLDAMNTRKSVGFYHYNIRPDGSCDRSVSQYGVLGVWACSERVEVDPRYWHTVDSAWRAAQQGDGGWNYADYGEHKVTTMTMTAAGVASLFITEDELLRGYECRGNVTNPNIEKGLKYIADNLKPDPDCYLWYGMERIGVASGRKYMGDKNWYDIGLHALLPRQLKDGSIAGVRWGPLPCTDFALLFLCRGRAPVCMSKAAYTVAPTAGGAQAEARWNQRPRDLANFVHWMSKQTEQFYNWQSVTLDAPVSDLHDSPIIILEGDQALNLSDAQTAKLKQFIEEGGMVIGNPDCGSAAFISSFRELGQKMFPYEFRQLPDDHPMLTHEEFPSKSFKNPVPMMGLSNGVRELMVLFPSDLSAMWAVNGSTMHEEAFDAMADVWGYAIDLHPLYRDQTYTVEPDPKIKPKDAVEVARLRFDGNWDPEPYGWKRLGAIFHNKFKIDVNVSTAWLGHGELSKKYAIADLTGTGPLHLNETIRSELSLFVKNGGTLVVDAAGGDSAFAQSAERELRNIFPRDADQMSDPLPIENALYSNPKAAIKSVEYRRWARKTIEGSLKAPRVRGIAIGGRTAVFYSAEDLSAGLVGQSVDGVVGYTPEVATQIMRNIVLGVHDKSLKAAPPTGG